MRKKLRTILSSLSKRIGRVSGRVASILQDPRHIESSLWLAALQFLAVLLSEEGKLVSKVGQGQEDHVGICARLDSLGKNGEYSIPFS